MGHSLSNDVTNNIYIHKSVERLKIEIEKLNFRGKFKCMQLIFNGHIYHKILYKQLMQKDSYSKFTN